MNSSPLCDINTSFALILQGHTSKFPNSSRSAIRKSPFQILPAINVYPRKIPGKTLLPKLLKSWIVLVLKSGDIQPLLQKKLLALRMVLQLVFHKEFSLLPSGLGHFAGSNSIPQNQTTTFHPVLTVAILLKFLFSHFVRPFQQ